MKRALTFFAAAGLAALTAGGASAACGTSPDECEIPDGSYHIVLPEHAEGAKIPAVVFLHGWGGSGDGTLKNTGMVKAVTDRGYALIAPNGSPRLSRNGRAWNFHPDHRSDGRDEALFLRDLTIDATERFNLDPSRIVLGGFSIGGSMTSYVACEHPDFFPAYAPVAGSFWRPHPVSCDTPVRLYHTHGWRDGTVPLEGRSVLKGLQTQGDVFHAMEIWRTANQCTSHKPDVMVTEGDFMTRSWETCTPGANLRFTLHPGGHSVPAGWADMMLDWFEGLNAS